MLIIEAAKKYTDNRLLGISYKMNIINFTNCKIFVYDFTIIELPLIPVFLDTLEGAQQIFDLILSKYAPFHAVYLPQFLEKPTYFAYFIDLLITQNIDIFIEIRYHSNPVQQMIIDFKLIYESKSVITSLKQFL